MNQEKSGPSKNAGAYDLRHPGLINLFQKCSLVISRAVLWRNRIALGRHYKAMRGAYQ
jgi:hypothetical protein